MNGYGGSNAPFNLQDYAPGGALNNFASYYQPLGQVPQQPQQLNVPQSQPTAQNAESAPVQRSQSHQEPQGQRVDPRSISTERYRRDIANAPAYIPTPINGSIPPVGPATAAPQSAATPTSSAPLNAPTASSVAAPVYSRNDNQQLQPRGPRFNTQPPPGSQMADYAEHLDQMPPKPNSSPSTWISYHGKAPPGTILFRNIPMWPADIVEELKKYNLGPPVKLRRRLDPSHPQYLAPIEPAQANSASQQHQVQHIVNEQQTQETERERSQEVRLRQQRQQQQQQLQQQQQQQLQAGAEAQRPAQGSRPQHPRTLNPEEQLRMQQMQQQILQRQQQQQQLQAGAEAQRPAQGSRPQQPRTLNPEEQLRMQQMQQQILQRQQQIVQQQQQHQEHSRNVQARNAAHQQGSNHARQQGPTAQAHFIHPFGPTAHFPNAPVGFLPPPHNIPGPNFAPNMLHPHPGISPQVYQMMVANGQIPMPNRQVPMVPGAQKSILNAMLMEPNGRGVAPDSTPSQRIPGGSDAPMNQPRPAAMLHQQNQMVQGRMHPAMGQMGPNREPPQPNNHVVRHAPPGPYPGPPAHPPPPFYAVPPGNEDMTGTQGNVFGDWHGIHRQQPHGNPVQPIQNPEVSVPPQHLSPSTAVGIPADSQLPPSSESPTPDSNESVEEEPVVRENRGHQMKDNEEAEIIRAGEDDVRRVAVKQEPCEDEEQPTDAEIVVPSSNRAPKVQIKSEPSVLFQYIDRISEKSAMRERELKRRNQELEERLAISEKERAEQKEIRERERADAERREQQRDEANQIMRKTMELLMQKVNGLEEGTKRDEDKKSVVSGPVSKSEEVPNGEKVSPQPPAEVVVKPPSRSRSSSVGSDVFALKKKRRIIDCSEEEDSDGGPSTSLLRINKKKSRSTRKPTSGDLGSRRRVVVSDQEDDDEMPKRRGRKVSSEEDEDYRQEEEEEDDDDEEYDRQEEVESDSAFINDGDEDDDGGSMDDFVCGNDEIEYEDGFNKKRKVVKRKHRQSSSSSSKCPSITPRSKTRSSNSRTPSRSISSKKRHEFPQKNWDEESDDEPGRKKRSRRSNRRKSTPEADSPVQKVPRWKKLEANREKKHKEMLERMAVTPARVTRALNGQLTKELLDAFEADKQRPPPQPSTSSSLRHRRTSEATPNVSGVKLQKRPTTDGDEEDRDGTHVPAKRTAHSNSTSSGASQPRPATSRPGPSRRLPNQNDLFEKRHKEAEARKQKDQEERERLKKKKFLTQEETFKMNSPRIGSHQKGSDRVARSTNQVPAGGLRKVTIKKEVPSGSEPDGPPPPKLLEPTKGMEFLQLRRWGIGVLFKQLYSMNPQTAAAEAQRLELEEVVNAQNGSKYKTNVAHHVNRLKRENPDNIIEVNKNAVSHSRNLNGAKENFSVGTGPKKKRYTDMTMDELFPALFELKMTDAELERNAYPLFKEGPNEPVVFAETPYTKNKKLFVEAGDLSRTCNRCFKDFKLKADGTMVREKDICRYHHRGVKIEGKKQTFVKKYICCDEILNTVQGCMFKDVHTFDQLFTKELSSFVATPPPNHQPGRQDPRSTVAYAIDCEMVSTVEGPALARLSMVDIKGRQVLDLLIKPPTEVLDTNIEFSGLTMETVMNATHTLSSALQKLFTLINSETILIGHSLESDLKAMRLVHTSVIDTAVLFAKNELKVSLKNLMRMLLQKRIQGENEDAIGHDSLEDARSCIELIFYGLDTPGVIRKQ